MAEINVKTQLIDREDILRFVPPQNFRLVKFFENLASDVSQTIPDAIGATVSGPAIAGDGDLAIFDGTTGKKVKDSGVNIVDVALLNSPLFVGNPRAPTPPPGDSDTSIATTAFVSGTAAGKVDGPAAATDNAIALFSGTTGKIIKDSAVLLSTLAPLASPALTGNPTAPNQVAGDNDTSIANTAFVQNAVTTLSTAAAAFSAHNNGVAQSIPNATATKLTFSTEQYDIGSKFASSTWTPPANRPVMLVGAVGFPGAAGTGFTNIAIFKNGAEFKRGNQLLSTTATALVMQVTCMDVPNGTDTYDLYFTQNTGAALNTFGTSTVTYFQGTTVGS